MKRIAALIENEVRDKWLMFAASLLLGFFPFALTRTGVLHGRDSRDAAAGIAAMVLGSILAITLGYSSLGVDHRDRRFGFYFSRPLSAVEIWVGKILGGLSVVFLAAFLLLAPTVVAGGKASGLSAVRGAPEALMVEMLHFAVPGDLHLDFGLMLAGLLVILFLGAMAAGVAFRSRSPWLALDLLALGAIASWALASSRRLYLAWASDCLERGLAGFVIMAILGLAVGGLAAVAKGRTDLKRAHRALAGLLWATVGMAALGFDAYSRWVVGVGPRDLLAQDINSASPSGAEGREWVMMAGTTRGRGDYEPHFLWNPLTGRFLHIGDFGFQEITWDAFSPDGTVAAWMRLKLLEGDWRQELQYAELSRPSPVAIGTRMKFGLWPPGLVISPDNRTVATLGAKSITLLDLPTGSRRGSFNLPPTPQGTEGMVPRAHFLDSRTLEIFRPVSVREGQGGLALDVLRLDIETGSLTTLANVKPETKFLMFSTDPPGDRILLRDKLSPRALSLYRSRTGELMRRFAPGEDVDPQWADFLPDGKIALAEAGRGGARLRLFAPDGGQQLKVIDLGEAQSVVFGGWLDAGHVFLLLRPEGLPSGKGRLVLAGLRNGDSRPMGSDLYPVAWSIRWRSSDPALVPQPGGIASRLFYSETGSLVLYEPASGTFRTLIPGMAKK